MRWESVHSDPVSPAQFGYIHNPGGGPKKRKRNLSMTPRVHDTLHARWIAAGRPMEGWVFPGEAEEGFVKYAKIDSQHDRILRRMKLVVPFRLYDLRHTALTRLGQSVADEVAIQRIAGHTDIRTTSRYVHPSLSSSKHKSGRDDALSSHPIRLV